MERKQQLQLTPIAIWSEDYLKISLTFIYRQMLGVMDEFAPIVVTSRLSNQHLFPFEPVYDYPTGLCYRIYNNRISHTITGNYVSITPGQKKYWSNILQNNRTKLIHAHFGPTGLQILEVAKSLKIPLLVTFHGYDTSALIADKKYVNQLQDLFLYAKIITVSRMMADRLETIGADRKNIYVHYIGVPTTDFAYRRKKPVFEKAQRKENLSFLQVSNFVEKKGHKYTLFAFANFLESYPKSRLVFGGDGPLRKEIQSLTQQLGLTDRVVFRGKVSKEQVVHLMEEADVFLHHSITARDGDQEGIPTVIMEAMATGLPVISTYHSGIPELIEHCRSGYLVEEKNIEKYCQAMIEAVTSKDPIGFHARQRIETLFNIQKQNIKLKAIYKEIINDQ